MTDKHRTPLLLISGLSPGPNQDLADALGGADPGTAVVHHDLRQVTSGVVLRTVRLGAGESLTTLEPAHGCVSCTLREDLLPLLRRLAERPDVERIVLRLDAAMEPEQVSVALQSVLVGDRPVIEDVEIEAVATVFDAGRWLDDAIGEETLAERGLHASADDERTVAQVALAQVEFADVLVRAGRPPDAWTAAKTSAVLQRVAPTTPILELPATRRDTLLDAVPRDARRGTVEDPHGSLLRGQPPLRTDCGVTVLPFSARRPFHPQRLHEAINALLDGVVRTRGRVWIASRPDVALWIESAGGGLGVGHLGPWLDAPDAPAWEDVSSERRTLASLRWDPRYGDRHQEIVVITHDADPHHIEAALRAALLTDDELTDGRAAWARYPDPFGEWHEQPCGDTGSADTAPTIHNGRTGE
ncbi:ribosome hibernation factor-recruiting GTPase MRF [Prauserella oleivorans]|uniref:Ribosome hibernation factor-recruiting GTPase MRF n=1 Tax=Prauserella oleivorans TaxID=1478153 RepID=A0ABW5W453_9PSEU